MTAVASASAVTVMKLDKEGNVILKDELQLQADSNYSNEIQVFFKNLNPERRRN